MATLAIRGHATRGSEVIGLLKMLGGKNPIMREGTNTQFYYTIGSDRIIKWVCNSYNHYFGITLEEFLKRFPYKVGDKVLISSGEEAIIKSMYWNDEENQVNYTVQVFEDYVFKVSMIQPYKEKTIEGKLTAPNDVICSLKIDTSKMDKRQIIFGIDAPNKIELVLGDNFEVQAKDGKTFVVRKQPQYPKNYEECCKVLSYEPDEDEISCYKGHLIECFVKLLICCDAYWKMAGEEMGLGKPWEPDFENEDEYKYGLFRLRNVIYKDATCINPTLLIFPTAEMRDAFYENFKELIESCKELL